MNGERQRLKVERPKPEAPRLAVFTVCTDGDLTRIARQHLPGVEFAGAFEEYITANLRPHFPQAVTRACASVALIDFDRCPDQAIETAAVLANISSLRILTVGVSSRADAKTLLSAMRAGCSEFLEKPVEPEKFEEILARLERRVGRPTAGFGGRGQVISLLGAKGGVGATTLAVHLAVTLASRFGKKTLLIDLHHQLGHVCLYLGLKESHYHFDELTQNVERLDTHLLQGFLLKHASGLDVLGSPDTCAVHYHGTSGEIEQVLAFLRREYDCIVIDSSIAYEETSAATIQFSDRFYLVTTPDVAALRDLSRHVANISASEVTASKGRIIVNRATSHDAVGPAQIEKLVRAPISIHVPNNYEELQRAINAGQPIPAQRNSSFTAQITKWAALIASGGEEGREKVGAAAKKKIAFWR